VKVDDEADTSINVSRKSDNKAIFSDANPHLIISVNETRKLLGKDGRDLSDTQIEQLIMTLTDLSSMLLDQNMVPNNP
jgi:hypothetical protein